MTLRVGVDLGGTNIRAALLDEKGTILREVREKTEAHLGPVRIIAKLISVVERVKGEEKVRGIGIGCPGPLDAKTGIILSPPNLPGWDMIPLASMVEEHFQLPVKVDNDANVAAVAEAILGAGSGCESVYYLTVSTGVGGGFVINGKVFQGANGYAGEVGNMIVVPNGVKHPALNAGALETLASGTAIGVAGKAKGIHGGAEAVFREAKALNKVAQTIVNEAIEYLAVAIANLTHAINPEVFVVGGGVMNSEEQVLLPLRGKVKEYVYPGLKESVNIIPAKLGSNSGVIGAGFII
ncbi:ROK family protein [Rossellomorea yichunensis]|jgi:glucokinase|uniref:ROK family protein n=1 Tax=Rossellomorea yichunensis TaxID=3077331 RepID=UPI0028DFA86D|nr:ROK family protein [Rossellomorea sp. YC4-1]MDT9026919.1 ROK family protein [Rossellomorea sp. YC4-1]